MQINRNGIYGTRSTNLVFRDDKQIVDAIIERDEKTILWSIVS